MVESVSGGGDSDLDILGAGHLDVADRFLGVGETTASCCGLTGLRHWPPMKSWS